MCTCTHTRRQVCMHTHACACTHTYTHTHAYTYTHTHTHTHTHTYTLLTTVTGKQSSWNVWRQWKTRRLLANRTSETPNRFPVHQQTAKLAHYFLQAFTNVKVWIQIFQTIQTHKSYHKTIMYKANVLYRFPIQNLILLQCQQKSFVSVISGIRTLYHFILSLKFYNSNLKPANETVISVAFVQYQNDNLE